MDNNIARQTIKKLAQKKFFYVEFIKKNGELRKMQCQLGVRVKLRKDSKGLSATQKKADIENNLLRVSEVGTDGYRMINCDNLLKIKAGGVSLHRKSLKSPWIFEDLNEPS